MREDAGAYSRRSIMAHETVAPWGSVVPEAPYPMTADDLLQLTEDGRHFELIEGRLVQMPPVGGGHGKLVLDLGSAIRAFVQARGLGVALGGDVGFVISRLGQVDTVLAPDIAFVRAEHMPAQTSSEWPAFWRTAPDLAVEIASPSQYRPEMADKARAWLAAGVRLVWIVWPSNREVDVWRPGSSEPTMALTATDALDGMDVLLGFTYPIAGLFA
jgi:Uma2 family endonuclease